MKPFSALPMQQYKHIFFDLDHTLWDFDTNARYALTDLYKEFDLHTIVNAGFDDFYRQYIYHNEILWDRYQKGFISADELKWRRMWRTLLDFKIADEKLAKEISHSFLNLLPTKKHVFPHTFEILAYLQKKNYMIHLITNGFETTQWNKLRSSGMDSYFTHVITSEGSNSLKPKKEIFDYALLKSSAAMHECIMIGDNLEADIKGALNAGWDCVYVNHINAGESEVKATYTVTCLSQLAQIL